MPYKQVGIAEVARILALVADPPNPRKVRLQGDLEGDYDEWFDGGAVRYHTGHTDYALADGARAFVIGLGWLSVSVWLPDGRRVQVVQEQPEGFPAPVPLPPAVEPVEPPPSPVPVPPAPSQVPVPPLPWEGLPKCQHTGADFRYCTDCGARSEHDTVGPEPQAFTCTRCQGRTEPPKPTDTQQFCGECGCSMYAGRYCPWCGRPTTREAG